MKSFWNVSGNPFEETPTAPAFGVYVPYLLLLGYLSYSFSPTLSLVQYVAGASFTLLCLLLCAGHYFIKKKRMLCYQWGIVMKNLLDDESQGLYQYLLEIEKQGWQVLEILQACSPKILKKYQEWLFSEDNKDMNLEGAGRNQKNKVKYDLLVPSLKSYLFERMKNRKI